MADRLSDLGEFELIARLRKRFPPAVGVDVGIGDDAAAVRLGPVALLTSDLLVEGVHFDLELSDPEDVGHKAITVNASDIAAMGGTPRYALVGLAAPAATNVVLIERIADGIAEAAAEAGIAIVGGDTVASDGLLLAVTVAGEPFRTGPVTRGGARPGDLLCVTGAVGAAAAGLALLRRGDAAAREVLDAHPGLAARFRRPPARIREGLKAAESGAHAMIDVSDGLGADAAHLAEESGLGLVIEGDAVPFAAGVAEAAAVLGVAPLDLALGGGEDHELLVACSPVWQSRMAHVMDPTPLTVIGRFAAGSEAVVIAAGERAPLAGRGWSHFNAPPTSFSYQSTVGSDSRLIREPPGP